MARFLFIGLLQLFDFTYCSPDAGDCIYRKYFHKMLQEKHATISDIFDVQRFMECEEICLSEGRRCVGANVVDSGRYHTCFLFGDIRVNITENALLGNRNGKLIVKIKGRCLLSDSCVVISSRKYCVFMDQKGEGTSSLPCNRSAHTHVSV